MSSDNGHDYESLGANSTMTQNAIAGAMAGIGEHCIMYPIDSIRVSNVFTTGVIVSKFLL